MIAAKIIILFALAIYLSSCATVENTEILKRMAVAGAVGYAAGQRKSENKQAYSLMYAGIAASSVGAYSIYQNSKSEDKVREENKALKIKLDQFQNRYEPKLVQQGNSLFNSPIPKEVSTLVDPGEWKRYKLDQWVQDPNQSNIWYRQVEMFEIIPPVSR